MQSFTNAVHALAVSAVGKSLVATVQVFKVKFENWFGQKNWWKKILTEETRQKTRVLYNKQW